VGNCLYCGKPVEEHLKVHGGLAFKCRNTKDDAESDVEVESITCSMCGNTYRVRFTGMIGEVPNYQIIDPVCLHILQAKGSG